MKIKHFTGKNGRTWYFGKGTHDEVDRLNEEKDFDAALDVLRFIIKQYGYVSNVNLRMAVNKKIYGKRKTI